MSGVALNSSMTLSSLRSDFQAPRRCGRPLAVLALAAAMHGAASAQVPGPIGDTVAWTLSAPAAAAVKPGARVSLSLQGKVRDTWHVYGLKQLPTGPTPLRVAVEEGGPATAAGAATASPPTKVHDPSFGLETQYYEHAVTVAVPVRIGAKAAPGPLPIPVSVRYQTCDGKICQPPKTVRLTATVNVQAG